MTEFDTVTQFDVPPLEDVARVISDHNRSIVERMRCLFYARHHGGVKAVEALQKVVRDPSILLAHEAVYLIGQLGEACALPCLLGLLKDESNHCMVRHEAAEALAAIGETQAIPVIEAYVNDPSIPVRETCQLALRSLQEKASDTELTKSKFNTVDPIANQSLATVESLSLDQLDHRLCDVSRDLYERYEALFALRDLGTAKAYESITKAMRDTSSALFRHEVAFVLGQIRTPGSITALVECLENTHEHPMARHEAALALGSVACGSDDDIRKGAKDSLIQKLLQFREDPEPIVAESCLVALDNIEKETGLSIIS